MPLSCWQYLSSSKSFIPVQLAHGATVMVSPRDGLFQLKWGTTLCDGPAETLKKILKTVFSSKEKSLNYRGAQAGAQRVFVEAPDSGAGSARVWPAWKSRWTWACPHKSGQTSQIICRDCSINTTFLKTHCRGTTCALFLPFSLYCKEHTVLSHCTGFCKYLRSCSSCRQDKHLCT